MSTTGPTQQKATVRQYAGDSGVEYAPDDRGEGWVIFAGVMLGILAALNIIDGIAAVSKSTFFVGDAKFVISDLKTWGWVMIGIGAVQGVTAIGVVLRWPGVRWVGVAIAGLNMIAQLLFIPAYPFWSLALFALDVLVIYGLVAYGGRRALA